MVQNKFQYPQKSADMQSIFSFFSYLENNLDKIQNKKSAVEVALFENQNYINDILNGDYQSYIQSIAYESTRFAYENSRKYSDLFDMSQIKGAMFLIKMSFQFEGVIGKQQDGERKIISAFRPIFENITKMIHNLESSSDTKGSLDIAQNYGVGKIEILENTFIRLLNLFIEAYKKYKEIGIIDQKKIDIEAHIIAQMCTNIKRKDSTIDILSIPLFSYVDGPNIPEESVKDYGVFFKRIEDLYRMNYGHEKEFLKMILPFFRKKLTGTCVFKTLFWDRKGEQDFQKIPGNLVGCLYFSPMPDEDGRKIDYLGGVNLDPNFHKSGIAMFVKKAIKEQFEKGTSEIELDVISSSPAEKMWRKFGFEYVSRGEVLTRENGSALYGVKYRLKKEKFNQVFAEAR